MSETITVEENTVTLNVTGGEKIEVNETAGKIEVSSGGQATTLSLGSDITNISGETAKTDITCTEEKIEVTGAGPQGPPGASAGSAQTFTQASESNCWGPIVHNLGRRPIVQVTDAGGCPILGNVMHLSANVLEIKFTEPIAGQANIL